MLMEKLLQRCQTGDERAIQEMIGKHQAAVYRLALSILQDPAEAEEAAQDTFVAALSALGDFRGESSFSTWLASIAINLCRNRWKRRQAKERLARTLKSILRLSGTSQVIPEEAVIRQQSDSALRKAVNRLGEKHRLPVVLHYYHGYSVKEIARALKISPGTVLSRLHTARQRLRLALDSTIREEVQEDTHEPD
jgi:RNA polymerase sigma-70 factor, ECF subfamily